MLLGGLNKGKNLPQISLPIRGALVTVKTVGEKFICLKGRLAQRLMPVLRDQRSVGRNVDEPFSWLISSDSSIFG